MPGSESSKLKRQLSWALGSLVSIIVIIGAGVSTWDVLATDKELETVKKDLKLVHQTDIQAILEANKRTRIDAIEKEIRELDEELRFTPLSEEERAYKLRVRMDLVTKRQNIEDGN